VTREALRLVPAPAPPAAGELDLDAVNADLEGAPADEIVRWAHETFGATVIMSSSFGAESALMLHLVTRTIPKIPVVFLDTGYLFPETYQFADALTTRFDLDLRVYSPKMTAARLEALHGRLWDGGDEEMARYARITKVEPMDRAVRELGARAWLAGLRRSQTEHRSTLRTVELVDGTYKVHPILAWSKEDLRRYMVMHDLPYHPLFQYGYRSIGDVHSTVPTTLGQDERDGRMLGAKKECGIHLPRTPEEDASLKSSGL
jgi:phosphoadenosine phosphosulfate reductase